MLNLFKYFYQKIRQFLSKNVPILSDQNMSKVAKYVPRGAKCFNTPNLYTADDPFKVNDDLLLQKWLQ